jgi:hypothetical protein
MGWIVLSSLVFVLQVGAQSDAVVTQTMRIEIDKCIHTARNQRPVVERGQSRTHADERRLVMERQRR